MAVSYDELLDLWGAENIIHFPVSSLLDVIEFGPESLPPDGAMPMDVPILFTAAVADDDLELFSQLQVEAGHLPPLRLIVIGAVPDDPDLLFTVDAESGAVLMVDPKESTIEAVNSSFALFVEFLYRLGRLIENDPGGAERAAQAAAIREDLRAADPAAFEDPESWWSAAFLQLSASAASP